MNVSVESPEIQHSNSRSASPLKNCAWSPGILQDNIDDELPSFQPPKWSRKTAKVVSELKTSLIYSNLFV